MLTNNDVPATREQVVQVLELLATRMQWSSARLIIASTSLHTSRGWIETIESAKEAAYSDAIWTSAYKTLAKAAQLHTYVGNKHVSFFDLRAQADEYRDEILNWAKNAALKDLAGALRRSPFKVIEAPTTEEALEPYKSQKPKLIEARMSEGRLYLQFFSVRTYVHREPISISEMSITQQRVFADYDELIGVKTRAVPCFDTVVIDPESELVQIRVDFKPGMTEDKETPAFQRTVGELNRLAEKFIGHFAVGPGLMDLHSAINPLYKDDGCGRVTTLGFVATGTDSSSNNRGQLHRSKSKDFRKDDFHAGGKANVKRIDPYTIGVTWDAKLPKNDLYLEIHGNARAIYKSSLRSVTVATIVGCADTVDFDFVSGEVLSRLKRKPKK
jgi:hypothetical protein